MRAFFFVQPELEPEETHFMAGELTLDLDFLEHCPDDAAKAAFMTKFITELAEQLGCDPSQIVIDDLTPGSVKVPLRCCTACRLLPKCVCLCVCVS